MGPARIWWLSTRAHQRGWSLAAKLLKLANYLLFRAVLPYECRIQPDIVLWHRGLGTVVHPNTEIGSGVELGHGVTIAGRDDGPPMVIGDRTIIGAHAIILDGRQTRTVVGSDCYIGAGAVVIDDVPDHTVMVGSKARAVPISARPAA